MRASTHLYDMENITIDVIIVCRKKVQIPTEEDWRNIERLIIKTVKELFDEFTENDIALGLSDLRVVALGKCIEHYSRYYPNILLDGQTVSVSEALKSISGIIKKAMIDDS